VWVEGAKNRVSLAVNSNSSSSSSRHPTNQPTGQPANHSRTHPLQVLLKGLCGGPAHAALKGAGHQVAPALIDAEGARVANHNQGAPGGLVLWVVGCGSGG